jgi:DNA-binding response OmpR family regulator
LRIGQLLIDLSYRLVSYQDRTIAMSPKEFDLLAFLAQNPMQVFSRQELLNQVWGQQFASSSRTVDVHVRGLRAKLESDPADPQLIQTIFSIGYKFCQPVIT